jgi:hypothetical protein
MWLWWQSVAIINSESRKVKVFCVVFVIVRGRRQNKQNIIEFLEHFTEFVSFLVFCPVLCTFYAAQLLFIKVLYYLKKIRFYIF